MIAIKPPSRRALSLTIERDGVVATRERLGIDEQTMMRAALGVPLRDDVARAIDKAVSKWVDWVEGLAKDNAALRAEVERWRGEAAEARIDRNDLSARVEELRAEVERLQAVAEAHVADNIKAGDEVDAAASSLAAATELLERAADELEGDIYDDEVVVELRGLLRAFLADQPAARTVTAEQAAAIQRDSPLPRFEAPPDAALEVRKSFIEYPSSPVGGANLQPVYRPSCGEVLDVERITVAELARREAAK